MFVIPAKAGIHKRLVYQLKRDSRFRGNDTHLNGIEAKLALPIYKSN